MICKIMYQTWYGLYWSIKIWSKLGDKMFWLRGFSFTPLYTLWFSPQDFAKWKTLLRYIFVVTFISITYVVVKLKFFKIFCIISESMKGGKLGLNCPLGIHQRVVRNFHIAYNRTIHLCFLDANFHFLGICCSLLYPKETTTFFWFRTQSGPFWGVFGGNNSSKQCQIELKKY